ncbi:hypothetical protein ABZ783_34330 [Micromonospora sp. NPDC047738]|uniref:hypothetical protein n=1 Tax=Micromonospora sp. NPDC047738 TaxID=3155741 RepID=UPI0033CC92B0
MSDRPAAIQLAQDGDDLLYAPGIREFIEPSLGADRVTAYETLMVMALLWPALRAFGAARWDRYGSDQLKALIELRRHREGMPVDDLSYVLDLDDVESLLDELVRLGRLTRSTGPTGDQTRCLRITERAERIVDEYLERMADQQALLFDSVAPDRLALLRHVCLRMDSNVEARFKRQMREVSGGPRSTGTSAGLNTKWTCSTTPPCASFWGR